MNYNKTELKILIDVNKVVTICYITFLGDGIGESHDFHELVLIDKGPVTIFLDGKEYLLEEGDILLYPPNAFHTGTSNAGKKAGIISFVCESPNIKLLEGVKKQLNSDEKKLFFELIRDGLPLFETVSDGMKIKNDVSEYQLQIIKNRIELLIVSLLNPYRKMNRFLTASAESSSLELCERIYRFLEENVTSQLNLGILSKTFGVSITKLKTTFSAKYKCGIIEKFIDFKIEKAKEMLRYTNYNISEISEILGFNSPQYFTLQFKKRTGMTPTNYGRSIEP